MEGVSNGGNFHNIIYKWQRTMDDANGKALNFHILKLLDSNMGNCTCLLLTT